MSIKWVKIADSKNCRGVKVSLPSGSECTYENGPDYFFFISEAQSRHGEMTIREEDDFLGKITINRQTISTGNCVVMQELDSGQWIDPQAF